MCVRSVGTSSRTRRDDVFWVVGEKALMIWLGYYYHYYYYQYYYYCYTTGAALLGPLASHVKAHASRGEEG